MPLKSWKDLVTDAGDSGQAFEPLPDGVYDFVIDNAEHRTSAKGKDGYNITALVESGPYAKRRVFNTFWISPDSPTALGIFFRQMTALTLDLAFFQTDPSNEQIVAKLKGKRFRGTVTKETYQGTEKNVITNVASPNPALVGNGPSLGAAAVASPSISVAPTVAAPVVPTVAPTVAPVVAETTQVTEVKDDPWGTVTPSVPNGAPKMPF